MSWLLVVQPDSVQADVLREALRAHISNKVVVVASLDEALSVIDRRVPDLILLPLLMPAAVEDHLLAYLGTNPEARHVQILGLPHLERPVAAVVERPSRFWRPWRRRQQPHVVSVPVWDPDLFTRDVIAYLASATALKEEIELYGAFGKAGSERRTEPRFANDEVPWISDASFGGEQAALINVSSRGALLRTHSRPGRHLLRRSVSHVRHQSHLTLELESGGEVHASGRVVRCVPLTGEGPHYEIAFSFDDSVGLHLPSTALALAGTADDD